jgi:23S rRNA (cytosine1962-C5)-methyltransferase
VGQTPVCPTRILGATPARWTSAPARHRLHYTDLLLPTVRVNRKAATRISSGHPWIFLSDIIDTGAAAPGDIVKVVDERDRPLCQAHYSSTSQIALRRLPDPLDWRAALTAATQFRERYVTGTDAWRLVHAEGDFLPALIIDRYGAYFTLQALDQGMDRATPQIVETLVELFHPEGIVARNDAAVRTQENLPRETRILHGAIPERIQIRINGLQFFADLQHGQKTGIFLDQRENYVAAARYARGRALDCFTSSGGFALHLAAQCEHVEGVDSSERALNAARENQTANGIVNVEFREADVFDLLSGQPAGRRYDTIVLDPPAFAKSRKQLDRALGAYKEINLRALKLLNPGGILVSCSCSHHVSEAELLGVIAQAALDTRRTLRVLERRTQSQDHPILLTVPETHYLKCLVFECS